MACLCCVGSAATFILVAFYLWAWAGAMSSALVASPAPLDCACASDRHCSFTASQGIAGAIVPASALGLGIGPPAGLATAALAASSAATEPAAPIAAAAAAASASDAAVAAAASTHCPRDARRRAERSLPPFTIWQLAC